MSAMLGISNCKRLALALRQLAAWGAIRKVWVPGELKDFYELVEDPAQLIRGSYNNLIKPRLQSSKARLATLKVNLKVDSPIWGYSAGKKRVELRGDVHLSGAGKSLQTPVPIPTPGRDIHGLKC